MIRLWLIFAISGIWTGCLFISVECRAGDGIEEIEIPRAIEAGLGHFFDLADPDKTINFEPEKVAAVLNFINLPGKDGALYYADSLLHSPSAHYEFDIHQSFKNLVAYSFNPDIPNIASVPYHSCPGLNLICMNPAGSIFTSSLRRLLGKFAVLCLNGFGPAGRESIWYAGIIFSAD